MFRLGKKYRHFVHGTSCGCVNPFSSNDFSISMNIRDETFSQG